ncbi:MAG: EAL domain-containing protein [Gammaproteobacteria bacterium]|nr:EAL domain-containing protein [Gammaproteobacteria bacterium]
MEDDLAQADLIRALLDTASDDGDFRIDHTQRLSEAKQRALETDPQVVLLDLNLPDSYGLIGFQELHRVAPWLPVIILTNVKDENEAARAVRLGAQDYLIKREVETALLIRSIRYAIERQRAEEALRESEERYALAVAGANDGLWDWHVTKNVVYFSPRWKAILGFKSREFRDRLEDWFDRVHPEDLDELKSALNGHLIHGVAHFEHEHRVRNKAGQYLWVLCRGLAVRDESGTAYRIAGSLTDISARKRAEAQLRHDAMHDALTRLPNRTLYLDRLDIALRRYHRNKDKQFAVLFFDLDRFKNVNDSLGHSIGDELLLAAAKRLQQFLRPGDTLARLGGDEFAILLNDLEGLADAQQVAERIHELLAREFTIGGHEVYTSASIGIALSASHYQRPEEMLRDADLAMYQAKRSGDVAAEVFDSDMHQSAIAVLKLETDLRRAVERQEFVLHYQPIVSLATERIIGFEALLRWQHPERGLLHPEQFIGAAEETGLIVPICWLGLHEACLQLREWQYRFPTHPPLSVSINISGKLFLQARMAERVLAALTECGLSPECLHLEITESAMLDHREAALAELRALRQAGIELHVDDFGTGYSSLTYLQRFSYDSLKIDRSFVGNVLRTEETNAIVKAIIALGKMLGMNVIAEGVETREQLLWLREAQCPQGQGFWFSEPLDSAAVGSLLWKGARRVN